MSIEVPDSETKAQKPPEEKKIHHTHFPVPKIPLKETGFDSGYEWVKTSDGHWKRVPKKPPGPDVVD